jgi:hypothetical protein
MKEKKIFTIISVVYIIKKWESIIKGWNIIKKIYKLDNKVLEKIIQIRLVHIVI